MVSVARRIAVVQGEDSEPIQTLLAEIVAEWRAAGARVAGVIAEAHDLPDRSCSAGFLRDVGSDDRFPIYLDAAPQGTSCHLNAQGVDVACASVLDQIASCDLVVLSKLGKLEAMGQGLFPAFEASVKADRPIVTTVSAKHREAWRAFAPDVTYLDADKRALAGWWRR